MEVRKASGDPAAAGVLAAIERAKKDSMPKENIERAITKGSGVGGATLEQVLFEGYGPGGVAIVIEAVTDNNNRTAPEIRHIFTKAGFTLGAPGSAAWAFTKTTEGYVPTTIIALDDTTGQALAEFISLLEEQEDVTNVYTTADTPE